MKYRDDVAKNAPAGAGANLESGNTDAWRTSAASKSGFTGYALIRALDLARRDGR
jgi:hypothetical protein